MRHYKNSLERGYFVNFYMFAGGTNFGFLNGALSGTYRADVRNARIRYIPFATSYDVDAPITEYGEPTEKYYALKKVLSEHLGKPVTDEEPVKVMDRVLRENTDGALRRIFAAEGARGRKKSSFQSAENDGGDLPGLWIYFV